MTNDKPNRHLLRRVLVPLLIVALPISAMVAFILYHKRTSPSDVSVQTPQEVVSFGNESWPFFRGNSNLTGIAAGQVPNKLKPAWKFQTDDAIVSSAVVAENTVFITSLDGFLYAVDLKTGLEKWRFQADDELEASAVYFNQTVFFGSSGGMFYAVESSTGKKKWSVEVGGKITGAANIVTLPTQQTLVVFGSYDNTLYGYDIDTGQEILHHEADNYINGSIAAIDTVVSFGSCDANVYLIPADNPDKTRKIDTGSYVAANPVIDNGIVYAGNYEGKFLAADITTGDILWEYAETEDAFFSSAAVSADFVVVGCRDQKLYCFDRKNGQVAWTFTAGDNFDSSPVICGKTVIVGNDDGRLYLIDLQKGTEIFSYTLGNAIVSSPAVVQNHVLIGCDNGFLYALTAPQ